ncbi:putative phenylalanine ammonia-lyase protein [Botrytis fragariae]|uniref:Putative phenylalanine ammonia-lyase protein n=1 Tax=Botrytis fragariae TaxID=1964551 RepID=A0A8H6EMW2_9HELO|nr:putative phenylalanine ammonia-lyase protein [Botrytis fragariae]KAF5877979.1 putative phenylalanine ammonia-lyase protein [Botrytis fragariae]
MDSSNGKVSPSVALTPEMVPSNGTTLTPEMGSSNQTGVTLEYQEPKMDCFNRMVLSHWEAFSGAIEDEVSGLEPIRADGSNLNLATLVAIASEGATGKMKKSAEALQKRIQNGESIYGVNTGFGGSADVRPKNVSEVSASLFRMLHYGVISSPLDSLHVEELATNDSVSDIESKESTAAKLARLAIPLSDPVCSTTMPESWVRGAMAIRANTLAKGASAIRPVIVQSLFDLLNKEIIPAVPLRGSISASGDLSPLSYIGGALEGKPAIQVYVDFDRKLFQPKEGLSLVNGTAVTAAVASLAMHEAVMQALLSQILTAMSVEALSGTDESFNPFFAEVRPHRGQTVSAKNIYSFLAGSKLTKGNDTQEFHLRQDRYSIRTASQWIGPSLEDLLLSYEQVSIELNSTTDNPLVSDDGKMHHGGNFQAKSITSAVEKTRQACQSIGQMLFAQCTELINPATNNGLPPNLVADEPSESWMFKGIDIMIAALQSELGFLSNPVGSHVQTAEMGNQALNSLGLISSRYTLSALEVLTQLSAAHLVAICQALDLRGIQDLFFMNLRPKFESSFNQSLGKYTQERHGQCDSMETKELSELQLLLWDKLTITLNRTSNMDSITRFEHAAQSLQAAILDKLEPSLNMLQALKDWTKVCSKQMIDTHNIAKRKYSESIGVAKFFLGKAGERMYCYVRNELHIPFVDEEYLKSSEWSPDTPNSYQSIGSMVTAVYERMRSGELYSVAIERTTSANNLILYSFKQDSTLEHLVRIGMNMDIPSASDSIENAVEMGSKSEEIPKASETGNDETSNTWVSWTPGSGSVKGPVKTFHRKTKTGCIRCRIRKVKVGGLFPPARGACDECQPSCLNCKRHEVECKYDSTTCRKVTEKPNTENVTAKDLRTKFPETAERRLQELTLLHHYTTNTSRTVTFTNSANPDQTAIDIFTKTVPEIALTNEALLYSIYCISSLHLNDQTTSSTPNTSLIDAYTYLDTTLRLHRQEIHHLTPQNADAICLTSSNLRVCAFAMLQNRSLSPYTPPSDWINITRSASMAFKTACQCISSKDLDANDEAQNKSVAWMFVKRMPVLAHPVEMFDRENAGKYIHLLRRNHTDWENEEWSEEIEKAYKTTACFLGYVYKHIEAKANPAVIARLLIGFPFFIEQRFGELVQEGKERALVLLGIVFALFVRVRKIWWIGGCGEREARGILGVLGDEWRDVKEEIRGLIGEGEKDVYEFI